MSRLIWWHLGDLAHQVDGAALVEAGHVLQANVVWRETSFEPVHDPSAEYSQMLSELTRDPERNGLIVDDVAREAGNGGGVCLVLSDRRGIRLPGTEHYVPGDPHQVQRADPAIPGQGAPAGAGEGPGPGL